MNVVKLVSEQMKHYWSVYKTDQIMRLYGRGKYDKIIKHLSTFKKYEYVKINDYNFIFFAISQENKEFMDKFLNKISYKEEVLQDSSNPNKFLPTTFAVLNSLNDSAELLIENGSNIYAPNEYQNTLIHIACFYNKPEALDYALTKKFNLNSKNQDGDTCLHLAVAQKHVEIVKKLLENGADPLIKNNKNQYPIHEAIISGEIESVKLLEKSLSNIKDAEFTQFHLAAQLDSTEILHYFTEGKTEKMTVLDKHKATPLHYAVWSNSEESARYLLDHKIQINARDENGNTALHLAVLQKNMVMIQLLSEYHADAAVLNNDKQSPIDLCYSDRDIAMIKFFRSQSHYIKHFINQEKCDV